MASSKRSALTDQELSQTVGTAPSDTLKRHPGVELSKSDLWHILSVLEGELQAREITIATLKCDRAKQLFYQAKYGRFGLGDAFLALQRDSESQKNDDFDENGLKAMYDNQLGQLENLIATQRRGQQKMREQLHSMEKKYYKVLSELEEERRKHERDAAQGDDVLVMLEKERERLKSEVDYERSQNRKIEKDLKKVTTALEEELSISEKQKKVALLLIRERHSLAEQLTQERRRCALLERLMRDEKTRLKQLAESLMAESAKASKVEAALEKQMSDLDTEREALRLRLRREETRNAELQAEMERLRRASQQPPSRPPPEPPVRRTPETPPSSGHGPNLAASIPSAVPVTVAPSAGIVTGAAPTATAAVAAASIASPGQARRAAALVGGTTRAKSAAQPPPPQQQQQTEEFDFPNGPQEQGDPSADDVHATVAPQSVQVVDSRGSSSVENGESPLISQHRVAAVLRIEELMPHPDRGIGGLCRQRDILLGSLSIASSSSWEDVEEHLILLFLTFVRQLDHGENSLRSVAPIGLSVRSIRKFSFGGAEWVLNDSPQMPLINCLRSVPDSVYIHLHDSSSSSLDSLALQMMFSVPTLQEYLEKLETTYCLIFTGVKFSCKRYLVANFAAVLQLKFDKDPSTSGKCVRAHYSGLDNFADWLTSSGILMDENDVEANSSEKIFIITVTNIAHIYDDPTFQAIVENLGGPRTNRPVIVVNGQSYLLSASIYLLGSIDSHEHAGLPRPVAQALQCICLKVDEEPLSGLLTRRTRLVEAMPRVEPLFCRAVRWTEEMWLRLVSCLTRLGLIEAVMGPSVFVSCPLHSKSVDAVVKWFISVWNHAIVPIVRQAITRSSSPESPSVDRSGRVSDTAVYVLLQQAVVNGCPLPPGERDKLLGCLQGATALNPPWKRTRRASAELPETRPANPTVPSTAQHPEPRKHSRSLPMTPPTMPAHLSSQINSPESLQRHAAYTSAESPSRDQEKKWAMFFRPPNVTDDGDGQSHAQVIYRSDGDGEDQINDSLKHDTSLSSSTSNYASYSKEGTESLDLEKQRTDDTNDEKEMKKEQENDAHSSTVMTKLQELKQPSNSHTTDRLVASLQSLKALIREQNMFKTRQGEQKEKKDMDSYSKIPVLSPSGKKQKKSIQSLHSTQV